MAWMWVITVREENFEDVDSSHQNNTPELLLSEVEDETPKDHQYRDKNGLHHCKQNCSKQL
jgi:uncharacterized protein CbrC (UPF0167 family)